MENIGIRKKVIIPIQNTKRLTQFITFTGLTVEHFAITIGDIDCKRSVLVRIHSECLTGDVFGSHRCDCGHQLKEAIKKIDARGSGVIIYLRQEGRGIGLYSKLDAYDLQSRGIDTFKANEILGFKDDLRDYNDAVLMLNALNINKVELLTNNPDKVHCLKSKDIIVTKIIPTGVFLTECNKKYLQSKVDKKHHAIDLIERTYHE